jgi:heme-degrading monooxygenase HmoA
VIVRTWTGRTTPADAAAYERLVTEEILPSIAATAGDGYRGHEVARRDRPEEDLVEFLTVLRFDSSDAVEAMTGEEYEHAHVPDEARELLADHDERVRHYEVVEREDA